MSHFLMRMNDFPVRLCRLPGLPDNGRGSCWFVPGKGQDASLNQHLAPLTWHDRTGGKMLAYEEVANRVGIENHFRLIERLTLAPNREWVNRYLDLLKILVETTNLSSNDPRLVTSIPKAKKWFLPVSINNRYVLAPRRKARQIIIGIIIGREFDLVPDLKRIGTKIWEFSPLLGEAMAETPYFIGFDDAQTIFQIPETKELWLEAVRLELQRAAGSPYYRYHQPVVYEAAVNLEYRAHLLVDMDRHS